MTVRVAFAHHFNDADWLGGKNYFASLFGAIAACGIDGYQFVFVTGKKVATTLPDEFPWLEVHRTGLLDRMQPAWLARQVSVRLFDSDPLLARLLRRLRVDILSHSGHLGLKSGIRTLPWLYDFQFLHLPEYWQPKHIQWAEQRYRAACRQGDGIIVSSFDALQDLERFAPWSDSARHVLQFVSNPVDFDRLPGPDLIRQKYGLPADYFYLPNQFWTNKNHRLAVDALALLKAEGIHATIACTGKPFDGRRPEYFDELMEHCRAVGVLDRFKVLGVVPYSDLQGLMAHACAVINPSRFEGWSTTVEEAKTLRKRLLLSDIAVHREQSPTMGRFFGIDDAPALAHLIRDCLSEGTQPVAVQEVLADYDVRLRRFGAAYLEILGATR